MGDRPLTTGSSSRPREGSLSRGLHLEEAGCEKALRGEVAKALCTTPWARLANIVHVPEFKLNTAKPWSAVLAHYGPLLVAWFSSAVPKEINKRHCVCLTATHGQGMAFSFLHPHPPLFWGRGVLQQSSVLKATVLSIQIFLTALICIYTGHLSSQGHTHHKMQAISELTKHSHSPGSHSSLSQVRDSSSLSPRCSCTARRAHPAAQASPSTSSQQPFAPLSNHPKKRHSCLSCPGPRWQAGSPRVGPSLECCPLHHRWLPQPPATCQMRENGFPHLTGQSGPLSPCLLSHVLKEELFEKHTFFPPKYRFTVFRDLWRHKSNKTNFKALLISITALVCAIWRGTGTDWSWESEMEWVMHRTASLASRTSGDKPKWGNLMGTVMYMVMAITTEHDSAMKVAGKN